MPYFIIPYEKESCVFLTCNGYMPLTEATEAWQEVQSWLITRHWRRVLVDVTALQTAPEMGQLFDLAKLVWRDLPQGGRMALVVRWDQSRLAKLLEMLVRSVGLYLTVFVSGEQAEAWILGDSQDNHQPPTFNSTSEACHASSGPDEVGGLLKGASPCHTS